MRFAMPLMLAGALGALSAPALSQPAPSAEAERLHLRSLASTCAACHGTGGRAVVPDLVPGLAGRPREVLLEKMRALRDDKVGATIMPQLLKGYSEAQLEQLAAYFAAQPK